MRLESSLFLIPAIVGFFWLLAFLVFTPRMDFYRRLKRLVAMLSFFFLFASLASDTESKLMLHFLLFEQVCALAIIPSFLSFIKEYGKAGRYGLLYKLCCMLPLIHFVVGVETVYVAGFEESVRIYVQSLGYEGPMFPLLANNAQVVMYACYTYMFKTFMLLNFLLYVINLVRYIIGNETGIRETFSFLYAGGKANVVPVLNFLSLVAVIVVMAFVFGKGFYSSSAIITFIVSLTMAYVMLMFSLVSVAGPVETQTVNGIFDYIRERPRR